MKNGATKNNTRKMTICNKYFRREKGSAIFPDIRLCGKWLMESGFKGGHVIDITCEERKLVITLAEEQRFENLLTPFIMLSKSLDFNENPKSFFQQRRKHGALRIGEALEPVLPRVYSATLRTSLRYAGAEQRLWNRGALMASVEKQ